MRKLITFLALCLTSAAPSLAAEATREAIVYKNPQCGCCEAYADHLRASGFSVTVQPTESLAEMSREAGVPESFQGCHLTVLDGYVASGHVPLEAVERMLSERPEILGLALPGMPLGSPGMAGEKSGPFTIYALDGDAPEVYAIE